MSNVPEVHRMSFSGKLLETELAALFQKEAPQFKLLGKHGKPNPEKINPLLSAQVRQVFHRVFG